MQRCSLVPAVMHRVLYQYIMLVIFGVFNKYIKIFIIVKNAGIYQFKFSLLAGTALILLQ